MSKSDRHGHNFDFSEAAWAALKAASVNRCLCCGGNDRLEPDHVIPQIRGGSNSIGNMQVLCKRCNVAKSGRAIDYRSTSCLVPWTAQQLDEMRRVAVFNFGPRWSCTQTAMGLPVRCLMSQGTVVLLQRIAQAGGDFPARLPVGSVYIIEAGFEFGRVEVRNCRDNTIDEIDLLEPERLGKFPCDCYCGGGESDWRRHFKRCRRGLELKRRERVEWFRAGYQKIFSQKHQNPLT